MMNESYLTLIQMILEFYSLKLAKGENIIGMEAKILP